MPAHSSRRAPEHETDRITPRRGTEQAFRAPLGPWFAIQRSAAFLRALELCRMYAPIRRRVVFVGSIGIGKTTLAHLVHQLSGRIGRFVALSAGGIQDTLAHARIFGHMRGAFTGATESRPGAIESAAGGTLLLDDIANLSHCVQGALLQALQDRVFTPLGAAREIPVTCRELLATTQPLGALVDQGVLLPDFLSRIQQLVIEIPPLRERPEDVLPLAEYYLTRFAREQEWERPDLTADVRALLLAYSWPYNVREVQNVVECAAVHAHSEGCSEITPDHLPPHHPIAAEAAGPKRLTCAAVREALARSGGNRSEAARRLGVHRNSIYRYLPSDERESCREQ